MKRSGFSTSVGLLRPMRGDGRKGAFYHISLRSLTKAILFSCYDRGVLGRSVNFCATIMGPLRGPFRGRLNFTLQNRIGL
jgi:hypothetical protein